MLPEGVSKVSQMDLRHRSYIGVCRGGLCDGPVAPQLYILAFAVEVSVRMICGAEGMLALAEDTPV